MGNEKRLCMTAALRLKLENIVKEYPGCRANDGIDLTVGAGEIMHCWGRTVPVRAP